MRNKRLTQEQKLIIVKKWSERTTCKSLAKEMNCSEGQVRRAIWENKRAEKQNP